jgi:hypothetical protein
LVFHVGSWLEAHNPAPSEGTGRMFERVGCAGEGEHGNSFTVGLIPDVTRSGFGKQVSSPSARGREPSA